jgi:outer membrane autotransporter protein
MATEDHSNAGSGDFATTERRIGRLLYRINVVLAVGVLVLVRTPIDHVWAQVAPLPLGAVLTGPVWWNQKCTPSQVNYYLPSITTGTDANKYTCNNVYSPPNSYPSFVATASAAMVVTATPTQFVRVYCTGGAGSCLPFGPNSVLGAFMAQPSTIRGMTPSQIQSALALPTTPNMITTITAPTGSCILAAWGAPAFGGAGGTAQYWLAGAPTGPNCYGLQYLPASDYTNRQPIGGHALWYEPFAGGGNAGAVATALDAGPYPQTFTQMDEVYKSLDLLNYGTSPAPLRAALVQLDGEIYADYPTVAIGAGQIFLDAVHTETQAANPSTTSVQAWLGGIGGGQYLSGNGDSHSFSSGMGGLAGGLERRFDPALLGGVAVGFASGWFGTSGISGSGTSTTFAVTPYARYAPGPWYVQAALGYGYSWGSVNRTMSFINDEFYSSGAAFETHGSPSGNAFLSQAEAGYRVDVGGGVAVTPFGGMQGIMYCGNGIVESGGGAVDLHVSSQTTDLWLGLLGGEFNYAFPIGQAAPLQFTARLAWAYDFANPQRSAVAFLDGTPSAAPFTVLGPPFPRNAALFGLSAIQRVAGLDLFARYVGTAGGGSYAQAANVGVRFTF